LAAPTEFAGFASFCLSACTRKEVHAVDDFPKSQVLCVDFVLDLFLDESCRYLKAHLLYSVGIVAFPQFGQADQFLFGRLVEGAVGFADNFVFGYCGLDLD
jgi:hypothetical protein